MAERPNIEPDNIISIFVEGCDFRIEACVFRVFEGPSGTGTGTGTDTECTVVYRDHEYPVFYEGKVDWNGQHWVFAPSHEIRADEIREFIRKQPKYDRCISILRLPYREREQYRVGNMTLYEIALIEHKNRPIERPI